MGEERRGQSLVESRNYFSNMDHNPNGAVQHGSGNTKSHS